MKKNGFTIAELLTAMAIIGVVAALCVPMLQDKMPNKEALLFRKAYYLTERVVSELVNDDDLYPDSGNMLTRYLANVAQVSYNGENYGEKSIENAHSMLVMVRRNSNDAKRKFCGLFRAKLNANSTGDLDSVCSDSGSGFNFSTTDGISWKIPETNFSSGYTTIVVDVNGDKGENCGYNATLATANSLGFSDSCTKQPDRFRINVYYDGRVAAAGLMENEYLQKKNTTRGSKFETIALKDDGSIDTNKASSAQRAMNTELTTFSSKYKAEIKPYTKMANNATNQKFDISKTVTPQALLNQYNVQSGVLKQQQLK